MLEIDEWIFYLSWGKMFVKLDEIYKTLVNVGDGE